MPLFTLQPIENTSSSYSTSIEINDGINIIVGRPATKKKSLELSSSETFLPIVDKRLSNKHLSIMCKNNILSITDLSMNGVFLNGVRLVKDKSMILNDGDIITCVVPNEKHPAAVELPCWRVNSHIDEDENDSTQVVDEDLSNIFEATTNSSQKEQDSQLSTQNDVEMKSVEKKNDKNDLSNEISSIIEPIANSLENSKEVESHIGNTSSNEESSSELLKRKREDEEFQQSKVPKLNKKNEPIENISSNDVPKLESNQNSESISTTVQDEESKETSETKENKVEKKKIKYDEETLRLMKLMGATDEDLDDSSEVDDIGEELQCGICGDILYLPVALIPCLHAFCAPCYSQWMEESNTCPHCRDEVSSIRKNHQISNLVQKYLDKHPDKKRSDEEIIELNSMNTLTDDKLRELADSDNSNNSNYSNNHNIFNNTIPFIPQAPLFYAPRNNTCRECQTPGRDGFICSNIQTHVTCTACRTYFPLRGFAGCGRAQRCLYCSDFYCEQYFGSCPQSNNIRFVKLKDHIMSEIPQDAFGKNSVERDILCDYLTSKGLSVQSVFLSICSKLDNREMNLRLGNAPVQCSDYCCTKCANTVFEKLIYEYRKSIPNSDFPLNVRNKPNCDYGKECWTASRNLSHAQRYNHICENRRR